MNGVEVVGRCACGCATVTLRVDSAPAGDDVARPIPNEAEVIDAEGESVGGVLLFTRDDHLCELEVYSNSEDPIREIPSLERVRVSQFPCSHTEPRGRSRSGWNPGRLIRTGYSELPRPRHSQAQ
jgi:hypothetical protein